MPTHSPMQSFVLPVLGVVLLCGCLGELAQPIAGPTGSHDRTTGPSTGREAGGEGNPTSQPLACQNPQLRGTSQQHLRRLSGDEIEGTLRALFGDAIVGQVATSLRGLPTEVHGFHPERFETALTGAHIQAMSAIGTAVAAAAVADSDFVRRFTSCKHLDDARCVEEFVSTFGARAFRHPLPQAEVDRLVGHFRDDGDVDAATLIHAMLLDARFNLHVEQGAPEGERFRLDPFEVAARLSYRATGTPPDDLLWEAATTGSLADVSEVAVQVERLLATEAGRARVRQFFRTWFEVEDEPDIGLSDPYLMGADVGSLYSAGLEDFDRFIDHIVWDMNGDLDALFLDDSVFPPTTELADLYGTAAATDGAARQAMSGHRGALLRAATLMGGGDHSPIIQRGVMVRRRLLCDALPAPSQDIVNDRDTAADPQAVDHAFHSNRDVVASLTGAPECVTCHARINPLGFALEGFDSLARPRTEEKVYIDGQLAATYPIDTSTTAAAIEDGLPEELEGPDALVAALADSVKVEACIAKQVHRFHVLADEAAADGCLLADQVELLQAGATLRELIVASIANEDIFWRSN